MVCGRYGTDPCGATVSQHHSRSLLWGVNRKSRVITVPSYALARTMLSQDVCQTATCRYPVQVAKHTLKLFLLSGSHTILHRVPPNGHLFVLWNNSVKRERILIISVHRMLRKLDIRILYVTWNLLPHYLVKFRTSFRWLFVTGILLRNFLLKQLKCEIKTSKSMDFCCFPYTKVVRFSSQKSEWLWKEPVDVMWQLQLQLPTGNVIIIIIICLYYDNWQNADEITMQCKKVCVD